jgi:hypothetical protein
MHIRIFTLFFVSSILTFNLFAVPSSLDVKISIDNRAVLNSIKKEIEMHFDREFVVKQGEYMVKFLARDLSAKIKSTTKKKAISLTGKVYQKRNKKYKLIEKGRYIVFSGEVLSFETINLNGEIVKFLITPSVR